MKGVLVLAALGFFTTSFTPMLEPAPEPRIPVYASEPTPAQNAFTAAGCVDGWTEGFARILANDLTFPSSTASYYASDFDFVDRKQYIEVSDGRCHEALAPPAEQEVVRRYASAESVVYNRHYLFYELQRENGQQLYVAISYRPTLPSEPLPF